MELVIFEDKKSYLDSSITIDYNNPAIQKKSQNLIKSCSTEIEKVKCLFEFVRDEISHSFDIQNSEVTYIASDVLEKGDGICFAKSHLLAAMVRSIDILAGFCYQKLIIDEKSSKPYFILHELNAIYLNTYKRWTRLDARGNKSGIVTEFGIESEEHVFPIREELGEKILINHKIISLRDEKTSTDKSVTCLNKECTCCSESKSSNSVLNELLKSK